MNCKINQNALFMDWLQICFKCMLHIQEIIVNVIFKYIFTHSAFPTSAVLASLIRHRVEVNEVIMWSHCQQRAIWGETQRRLAVCSTQKHIKKKQATLLLTDREAHHGQLLIAVCVNGHQVSRLCVQSIPPETQTNNVWTTAIKAFLG